MYIEKTLLTETKLLGDLCVSKMISFRQLAEIPFIQKKKIDGVVLLFSVCLNLFL